MMFRERNFGFTYWNERKEVVSHIPNDDKIKVIRISYITKLLRECE